MSSVKKSFLAALCFLSPLAIAQEVSTSSNNLLINANGPLSVSTNDGEYSIKLGGRLHWDYNRSELNDQVDEDTLDIRRARLYVSGNVADWGYKIQFNIGEDGEGGTPEDLYVRYNGLDNGMTITVGRQKEPMGLTQLASSKDKRLLERTGAVEAFTPNRSNGILLEGAYQNIYYATGLFEDDDGDDGFNPLAGTSDFAFTSRVASDIINNGNQLIHLGASYTTRGGDVDGYGLEAAITAGNLHFQTEYLAQDRAGEDFDGYYFEGSWVITGESIPYSKGVFGRIKPNSPSGAWELVARYEAGDGDYSDIELGFTDASATSIGVNWYPTNYIRFGLNYTTGDDDLSDDSGNELRARLQFAI